MKVLQKITFNVQVYIQSQIFKLHYIFFLTKSPTIKNCNTNPDRTVVLNITSRGSAAHKTLTSGLQWKKQKVRKTFKKYGFFFILPLNWGIGTSQRTGGSKISFSLSHGCFTVFSCKASHKCVIYVFITITKFWAWKNLIKYLTFLI